MKVLFVCSGNSDKFDIAPFIQNQADSLVNIGLEVSIFKIKAKGISGYLKHVKLLKKHLKYNSYDIVHAHYSFCGWVAVLSRTKTPIVLSLMGSDTYGDVSGQEKPSLTSRLIILQAKLIQPFCDAIIVKSENLYDFVWNRKKASIIPNGINISKFTILDKNSTRKQLDLPQDDTKLILFVGARDNGRKNFKAVEGALSMFKKEGRTNLQIVAPFPVKNSMLPLYYNACDVLVFPSFAEGSPNVVKEAMACNIPIVATEVGDIKWLFGESKGLFLSGFEYKDIKENIDRALITNITEGRERILELQLDDNTVANKLHQIYLNVTK